MSAKPRKIALIGSPNVGKSAMFVQLTGAHANVSNYPGTTVEIARGRTLIAGETFEVIDTPGMHSLIPVSEEERVARNLLFNERPDCVIHIVDAKNLERLLPLTLQLIEAEFPILLALNMMDEAEEIGIRVNLARLEREIGAGVVTTVSTTGRGISFLKERIKQCLTE